MIPVCFMSAETVCERNHCSVLPFFFQYARAFLCKLRFCLARQTNSFRLNGAWAINISWLVSSSKSSTMKISRAIDNAAVWLKSINTMFTAIFFPVVHHFVKYVAWPGRTRVGKSQISYKRSVKLSRGKGCLEYSRKYKWGLKHTLWKKSL